MIVRNLEHPQVKQTQYQAHGGGVAHMLLTHPTLQTMMFLAHARVAPGRRLEGHVDPMEEIYIIVAGEGLMQVEDQTRTVRAGDAVHIPIGSFHQLSNQGSRDLEILVVAGLVP